MNNLIKKSQRKEHQTRAEQSPDRNLRLKVFIPICRESFTPGTDTSKPAGPVYEAAREIFRRSTLKGKSPKTVDRALMPAAIQAFERALDIQPENFYILGDLGFCHFLLNENAESLSYYKRAVTQAPEHPLCQIFFNDMGTACVKMDDIPGAFYHYGKAIELSEKQSLDSEKSSFPYKNIALLYKKTGDYHAALVYIKRAIEIEGNGSYAKFYQKIKDEILSSISYLYDTSI